MAGGGGTTAGVGNGTGFRLWAAMLAPITIISSSRTPATRRIFFVCSKPVILKLLPSSSFNFVVLLCLAAWGIPSSPVRITVRPGVAVSRNLVGPIVYPQQVLQE